MKKHDNIQHEIKNRIHVLHVIESLEFGGAEKVVVHLANKLSERYDVSICLSKRMGQLVNELNEKINIYFLDTGEGSNLAFPRKLASLIEEKNVDILHSHDWGVYLEAALAVKLAKTPRFIHTVHGQYINFEPGWWSNMKIALRHFLERRAINQTYRVVSVSDAIKYYIVNDIGLPSNKLQTIHNGIAGLTNLNRRSLERPIKAGLLRLISVGRIAEVKNYPLLIYALQKALKTHSTIHLDIVGDGPELNALVKLTEKLGVVENVRFLGFRQNIADLLMNNDVFVLSSNYEGISIAILEAMSLSMPIIATNVGGIPETVIDGVTGYLVEKGDIDSYAEAILKLATSRQKIKQLGIAGLAHFKQNFHEEGVLQQYTKLYNGFSNKLN